MTVVTQGRVVDHEQLGTSLRRNALLANTYWWPFGSVDNCTNVATFGGTLVHVD